MHDEIFSLCYYGQGGWTAEQAYFMPVSHRKFYLKRLVVAKEAEKAATEKSSAGPNDAVKQAISRPNVKNLPQGNSRGTSRPSSKK